MMAPIKNAFETLSTTLIDILGEENISSHTVDGISFILPLPNIAKNETGWISGARNFCIDNFERKMRETLIKTGELLPYYPTFNTEVTLDGIKVSISPGIWKQDDDISLNQTLGPVNNELTIAANRIKSTADVVRTIFETFDKETPAITDQLKPFVQDDISIRPVLRCIDTSNPKTPGVTIFESPNTHMSFTVSVDDIYRNIPDTNMKTANYELQRKVCHALNEKGLIAKAEFMKASGGNSESSFNAEISGDGKKSLTL